MYAISLTSVPPRFGGLPNVLRSLLGQSPAPVAVFLCLPKAFRRFPDRPLPDLPDGVTLLQSDGDLGPATKVLPAARHLAGSGVRLIYCDDDWIYGPGWAEALLSASGTGIVAAGSGFSVSRLRRSGAASGADIAQGFSGVSIAPRMLMDAAFDVPEVAWPVDDIWLSGHYAAKGLKVTKMPAARAACQPLATEGPSLQDAEINGRSRAQANQACAALLHQTYGIWPPLSAP